MPKLTDFAAIIFDMDGLVLDTEPTYRTAWQQAAALMGYDFSDAFCASLSGLSYEAVVAKIIKIYGSYFNFDEFNILSSRCWYQTIKLQGITVKTGFKPLLDHLNQHQIPYGLATNSPVKAAEECLAYAGLSGIFTTLISRDDVDVGKPAPDIFFMAAEKLQVNITDCLILEDSITGLNAAWASGAFVVWVPETANSPEPLPTCYHFKAHDLVQVLQTFGT